MKYVMRDKKLELDVISRSSSNSYFHFINFSYIGNVNLEAFEVRKDVKFTVSTDVENYTFYKENLVFIWIKAVTYFLSQLSI